MTTKRNTNSLFKRGSGVFKCRHCKRSTRDTTGDNGDVELCEDCYEGCMWENGGNDASDEAERATCFAKSDAHFQNAVNKGGTIKGYTATGSAA
jgi:hypothetical protein